jgi:hypothetical protein
MVNFLMWYLMIGFGIVILLMSTFLIIRQRINNAFHGNELILRSFWWWLAWPIVIVDLVKDREFMCLFETTPPRFRKLDLKADGLSKDEIEAFWLSLPLCGKYVSVIGKGGSRDPSGVGHFIFDVGVLAQYLDKSIWIDIGEIGGRSEKKGLKKWLETYQENLEFISKAPTKFEDLSHRLVEVLTQGIGECYCAKCNKTYLAKELIIPATVWNKGHSCESILCPHEHTLHTQHDYIFL